MAQPVKPSSKENIMQVSKVQDTEQYFKIKTIIKEFNNVGKLALACHCTGIIHINLCLQIPV